MAHVHDAQVAGKSASLNKSSASIASLQQGRAGRLSRRSSRSITSPQQGRSGRLSRRSSRSITSLRKVALADSVEDPLEASAPQQGRSGGLSRRSSRSITASQQGRSGRLSDRISRSPVHANNENMISIFLKTADSSVRCVQKKNARGPQVSLLA